MQGPIAVLVLVVAAQIAQTSQPSPTPPPDLPQVRDTSASRTLVVTYSDGRTVSRLLNARGSSVAPRFPQRANAPTHEGLALSGLQVDFVVDPDVVVTVSLRYGSVFQKTVPVATVRLNGSEPRRIEELEAFGVDPIVLSLGDFPTRALVQPTVTSVSPLLDASVELTQQDLPVYKVTLRNRSGRAVIALTYQTFRGETATISGRRKTNRSTPVVDAAGEHIFTTQAGGGPTPGFDRFEVTAVLWDNGTVEGDPWLKSSEEALAFGQIQQLRRVLDILRAARPGDSTFTPTGLAQVRAAIESLPVALDAAESASTAFSESGRQLWVESGQQQVIVAVRQDLDDYVRAHPERDPAATLAWVATARVKYSAWLERTANFWASGR